MSHRPSSYTAAFITGRGEARGVWNKWAAGFYIKGPASTRFSHAFGRYLLQSGLAAEGDPILIGQDLRNSSPQIALNCTNALAGLGFRVLNCGAVPTPALALYGLQLGAASLMVIGSHIPADRNGIKFCRTDGEINKHDEETIAALAGAEGVPQPLPSLAVSDNRSADCLGLFLVTARCCQRTF